MSDTPPDESPRPTARAVKAAKAAKARVGKAAAKVGPKTIVGAAVGIGSAAIVAALLYANRNSKKS